MKYPTKEEFENMGIADKLITWGKLLFGLAVCMVALTLVYDYFFN
jgi:hypothetical protein